MIKRYGFGLRAISVGHGESVKIPDIVEQVDGCYVRYEDYLALSEAIGAGGVSSERITQQGKAIEQHRAEFESWLTGFDGNSLSTKRGTDGFYTHYPTQRAWQAWKAARGIKE